MIWWLLLLSPRPKKTFVQKSWDANYNWPSWPASRSTSSSNFQKLPANVKTRGGDQMGPPLRRRPSLRSPVPSERKHAVGLASTNHVEGHMHVMQHDEKYVFRHTKFSCMTWNDTKGVQIVELFWTHHSHIGRQECVRQSNQPCLSCLWKGISMHIMHLLLEIHWPSKVEGYFANAAGLSLPRRFEAFSLPWSIQPKLTTLHLSLQTWLWDFKNLQNHTCCCFLLAEWLQVLTRNSTCNSRKIQSCNTWH